MRILLLLLLSTNLFSQKLTLKDFKPTKLETLALGLSIIDGVSRGFMEAYHADNYVFEKKWNVEAYSFWGNKAWERNYVNNRYQNLDGSINNHKPEYLGNFGRDIWHTMGDVSKASGRLGGCAFGISTTLQIKGNLKKKLLPYVVKGLILYSISSLTEKIIYDYLR